MPVSRFADKAFRREWFLARMHRTQPSAGSDFAALMALPRKDLDVALDTYFQAGAYALVGGVATRAYQPERATKDVDVLVPEDSLEALRTRLQAAGGRMTSMLSMPDSHLGLEGEAWSVPSAGEIVILWSRQPWAREALAGAGRDQTGEPVVSLGHLVLMKLDASRGIDQGDLSRMLGLADDVSLEQTRAVVRRYFGHDLAQDLESYIELGRLEVGRCGGDASAG
ncbi:MAG: hypothetical protein ACLPYS_06615 [Vulcanimicrobiaceae bacterium]